MNKFRLTIYLVSFGLLVIFTSAYASQEEAITPPNIIVFLVDDMGLKNILDGFPLQAQLNAKQNTSREELFLNHFPHGNHRSNYFTSLVKSNWKVIYHYPVNSEATYELFNLKADPFEMENLAESNPAQLKAMMEALSAEMTDKKAKYPEKDGKVLELIVPK